jgi:hypothetical protein
MRQPLDELAFVGLEFNQPLPLELDVGLAPPVELVDLRVSLEDGV